MQTRILRALVLGVSVASIVAVGAAPGGTQAVPPGTPVVAVSGHATGTFLEVGFEDSVAFAQELEAAVRAGDATATAELLGDVGAQEFLTESVGPIPTVTLPPEGGGPFTDSVASTELELPPTLPVTGAIEVSTQGALGPTGYARSNVTVADVNPQEALELLAVTADAVDVSCSADVAGGVTGATTIANGVLGGSDPIPSDPAPNTILIDESETISTPGGDLEVVLRVVANEQTVGANDITVRGIHQSSTLTLLEPGQPPLLVESSEWIVGEAACGFVPGAVAEPTFTG